MRTVLACGVSLSLGLGSAAMAQDLSGFYAGLSMTTHSGSHVYDDGDEYDLEGPAFGGFVGYMMTSGNLSYGGELAASKGGVYEVEPDDSTSYKDEYEYTRFLDLKGRVGYTMDKVFLYGTVGLSRAHFVSNVTTSVNSTGNVFGVGADYNVNDKFFVGAEYLRRNYDYFDPQQDVDIDASINSISLRGGIKF